VGAENLAKISGDSIPNRHAAIHGYVSYDSAQSSLNAIFITDYIFQVIQAAKAMGAIWENSRQPGLIVA
jgi:hypothetical protein